MTNEEYQASRLEGAFLILETELGIDIERGPVLAYMIENKVYHPAKAMFLMQAESIMDKLDRLSGLTNEEE